MTNYSSANDISEYVPGTGTWPSGSSGFTGGGLNTPAYVAIDSSGNVWVTNHSGNSISKFVNGTEVSGSSGFKGGGFASPYGIAIDGAGNVWVVNSGSGTTCSLGELVGVTSR